MALQATPPSARPARALVVAADKPPSSKLSNDVLGNPHLLAKILSFLDRKEDFYEKDDLKRYKWFVMPNSALHGLVLRESVSSKISYSQKELISLMARLSVLPLLKPHKVDKGPQPGPQSRYKLLPVLETFKVSDTCTPEELMQIVKEIKEHCPKFNTLDLSDCNNRLSAELLNPLKPSLKRVLFNCRVFKADDLDILATFPQLTSLSVHLSYDNRAIFEQVCTLKQLSSLEIIPLADDEAIVSNLHPLSTLPLLRELTIHLHYCILEEGENLVNRPRLERLNQAVLAGASHIASLTHLEKLVFHPWSDICDEILYKATALNRLKEIHFSVGPTLKGIRNFLEHRPKTLKRVCIYNYHEITDKQRFALQREFPDIDFINSKGKCLWKPPVK